MDNRLWRFMALLVVFAIAMGTVGCQTSEEPAAQPEGEQGAVEEVATEEPAAEAHSQVPLDTYVIATIGEPESLDPAWTYETSGAGIESQIYEGMVYFNREKADEFVPALAESWEVSDDGLVYTFNIREGVTFHEGGTLEPHDIAYSLQRALLQDRSDGPMWLFQEPILGTSSVEQLALETAGMAEVEEATLDDVPPEVTTAICELVQTAVSADDEAGTVTIMVQQPTPWFLQLASQVWAGAEDQEWMVEQGDWDGSCETWTEFHDPAAEESVLFDKANGTGPYKLAQWKKGQEITLEGNEDYWRTEPMWDGGPSGPPALKHIVIQTIDEWGTRFAKLSAGEADTVVVPRAEISQVDPMVHIVYYGGDDSAESEVLNEDGWLVLYKGYPTVSMTAAMFNFDINPDSEFIGSGSLDGEGIPPDFFSDIHVRKGFNYCFDWDTFIAEALQGEGFQARGPIIKGLQGYSDDSDIYSFDIDKCEEELSQAWDGQLPETGFTMNLAYNQGNDTRKMAAEILAEGLARVNENYVINVVSLEWPSFLDARSARSLPISVSGWLEDYHDASNWVHPFMHSKGAYARAQSFPPDMQQTYDELIDQGVLETDEAKRDEIYAQLQQLAYDDAIDIFLHQATGRAYMNEQVKGWYVNPLAPSTWYYPLYKESTQ
jgi:peptide/nickel transport system substrate-binding protein